MSSVILLDSGILGAVIHPRQNAEEKAWLRRVLGTETSVLVPEIADYEVRRELLRADKPSSIDRLDRLGMTLGYLPITTSVMRRAAQ